MLLFYFVCIVLVDFCSSTKPYRHDCCLFFYCSLYNHLMSWLKFSSTFPTHLIPSKITAYNHLILTLYPSGITPESSMHKLFDAGVDLTPALSVARELRCSMQSAAGFAPSFGEQKHSRCFLVPSLVQQPADVLACLRLPPRRTGKSCFRFLPGHQRKSSGILPVFERARFSTT